MDNPLISIIIPTWNRDVILKNTIHSAIKQTIKKIEIIVIDDGSTDNTEDIIKSINDNRIKYIKCSRSGRPSIPRNIGIQKSSGEWLAFLDSDDEWIPTKLEKQLKALKALGHKICCTNAKQKINHSIQGNLLNYKKEKITFEDLLTNNYVINSSVLMHRSIIDQTGAFPEQKNLKAIEDYALWIRISTIEDFLFLNKPLVIYNESPDSIRVHGEFNDFKQKSRVLWNFLIWSKQKKNYTAFQKKALKKLLYKYIYLYKIFSKNRALK